MQTSRDIPRPSRAVVRPGASAEGRIPPALGLCRSCDAYVDRSEATCPHCGADVHAAAADHAKTQRRRAAIMADIERSLAGQSAALPG